MAVIWVIFYKTAVKKSRAERIDDGEAQVKTASEQKEGVRGNGKKFVCITVCILCLYAIIVNLTKDGLTTWVPSILKEEFALKDSLSILLTLLLPIVAIFGNLIALYFHKKVPDYVTHCFLFFALIGGFVGMIIASISFGWMLLTLIGLVLVNFLASSLNSLIASIFPIFMRGKVNSGLFAGVLNGFCYIGSTISSYGLGAVADNFGWTSVFWLLIGCCALASLVWLVYYIIKVMMKKKQDIIDF